MEKNPQSWKKKIGKDHFGWVDTKTTRREADILAEQIRDHNKLARVIKVESKQYGISYEVWIGRNKKK